MKLNKHINIFLIFKVAEHGFDSFEQSIFIGIFCQELGNSFETQTWYETHNSRWRLR